MFTWISVGKVAFLLLSCSVALRHFEVFFYELFDNKLQTFTPEYFDVYFLKNEDILLCYHNYQNQDLIQTPPGISLAPFTSFMEVILSSFSTFFFGKLLFYIHKFVEKSRKVQEQ